MELKEFFSKYPKTAIAYSGGVDSSYLLYAAKQYGKKVKAYYVNSAFQARFELEDAKRLAEEVGVDYEVIPLDALADRQVASNPADRCYFCKKKIMGTIIQHASKDGFHILLDGTNASDDAGDRPGMRALQELSILSPLRLCGLTKNEIRRRSKDAGLFTWDKPAYACLATRIPSGQTITASLLQRTEEAEQYLFTLGFRDFRVRTVGDLAKIQIQAVDLPLLMEKRQEIQEKLSSMYSAVTLDLEMRDEH